ncbi:MKT1 Post-transcriptional regulator MKT1 [Candida maltosa Xu316]
MPINSLESLLFERKQAHLGSIEILSNAVIGIDVEHYLSRIYTHKKEQYLPAIGGIPTSLRDYIKSDLQVFQEFHIKPIFVISGLRIQLQSKTYKTNELNPAEQHIDNIWKKFTKESNLSHGSYGHGSGHMNENFRLVSDPLNVGYLINDIVSIFLENDIDYLITPYDASFQLSYLYQSKTIDMIYGSTDLLLTKVDKFILGMEFQSKEFRFINKAHVLQELNLNERQFSDLCLLVGCNLQPETFPIFPPIPKPNPMQPFPQLSYFKIGLDMLYHGDHSGLLGYVVNLNNGRLLDLYYKGVCAIKYVPILNRDGYVELYNVAMAKLGLTANIDFLDEEEDEEEEEGQNDEGKSGSDRSVKIPNDIHDIISQRLPPELYFYQSLGLLPLQLLESITKGELDIRPPLELGSSESYKSLISSKFYQNLLDYQYNLITQLLARYYQVKKIKVKYWFKNDVIELNNRMNPPFFKRIEPLFIQNDKSGDKFELTDFFKSKLTGNYTTNKEIKTYEDIVSTVLLRTLYMYGILTDKKELSTIGKILVKLATEIETTQEEFEHFVLLILLLQSKTLVLNDPGKEYLNVSANYKQVYDHYRPQKSISSDELKKITLVSRIFTFSRLNISPINYQGPISRNLLNFRSHLEFLNTNLINSLQVTLIDFIVHQEQNEIKSIFESKGDWYKLVENLPFFNTLNNTLMGIMGEIYFETALKQEQPTTDNKKELIQKCQNHLFEHVYQINIPTFNINVHGVNAVTKDQLISDFENSVGFWDKFVKLSVIVNDTDKTLISDAFLKEIKETDEFVHKFV